MREIKFRAWDKQRGKMLYNTGVLSLSSNADTLSTNKDYCINPTASQFILMQYTGLKDKNGKEVYEGDIVRLTPNRGVEDDKIVTGPVVMGKHGVYVGNDGWQNYGIHTHWIETEIIGNIYENPELLPKQ